MTRADQILAQLDVEIAAELGEDVTPEVLEMARAEVIEYLPNRSTDDHDMWLFSGSGKSSYVLFDPKRSPRPEAHWSGSLEDSDLEAWVGITPLLLGPEGLAQYLREARPRRET